MARRTKKSKEVPNTEQPAIQPQEEEYPRLRTDQKYVDFVRAQQIAAKSIGRPVADYEAYDPLRKKGRPKQFGQKVVTEDGKTIIQYPEWLKKSSIQGHPEYDEKHQEEKGLPIDSKGQRAVYGVHQGRAIHGAARWPRYFKKWDDIGPQFEAQIPPDLPLTQNEVEFCRKHGFEFQNKLGSGSYGAVWRVRQKDITNPEKEPRVLAVKVMTLKTFKDESPSHLSIAEVVNSMLWEVEVLKGLPNNRNIIKFEYVFNIHEPETGFPYIRSLSFMELCQGDVHGDLEKKPGKKYTEGQARYVMRQVCRGLKLLHDHNIVHFDIKPLNILYRIDPASGLRVFKLADFGLAKKWQMSEIGLVRTHMGTDLYKAPELDKTSETDAKKADIYSLGSTLIELVVGRRDLKSCRKDLISYDLPQLAQKWNLSQELLALVARMTLQSHSDRPTIDQVMADPWFMIWDR